MLAVIVFVAILGILIFVHELGHFVVARRNGIKAEEFGFGFPPRIFGFVKDSQSGKWKYVLGSKSIESENTIYSINWIPLGGFVRIKGEDSRSVADKNSFAGKSAWIRIKVLVAGVMMNFVLAWLALSLIYVIGAPQPVGDEFKADETKVQITEVKKGSPAEKMGIKVGDEVIGCKNKSDFCQKSFLGVGDVQGFINNFKGSEINLEIKRGKELFQISGVPRTEYPANEGALGVSLVRTAVINYPIHEAVVNGAISTLNISGAIISTMGGIIKNLAVGEEIAVDVSGPVGIAILSKQVTDMGFVYILQFMAMLSINLGLINIFPFPALDGGRILFILIEKIKGSPVTQNMEQITHTAGFIFLIGLMILVTFNDLLKLDIVGKIRGIF